MGVVLSYHSKLSNRAGMMRVLVLVITLLASAFASQLPTADNVEELVRTHAKHELTETETQEIHKVLNFLRTPKQNTEPWNDAFIDSSIDCLVCQSAFAAVFEGVRNGQTDKGVTDVIVNLCINLNIQSKHICDGAVSLNIPIITHIIRTTPEATPRSFCGHVLQNAHNPNFCRVTDPRFEWQVNLPPPATPSNPPPVDTKPLKIAFITDAHIDPLYEAFGVAECGEPTCCRKGQSLPQSTVGRPAPAGYWGDYRNCDTPLWAYDDLIDRVAETHKDIDVVYYVGDTIDHFVWETTYELINDVNRHLIKKMRSSFGDDVLVIPTLGNHESQPTNQFAPSSVKGEYINTTWLYDALAEKWDHYLTEAAKVSMKDRGEFSILVRPGLRVISLNNNVAFTSNWWLAYDPLDAKRHLDWLVSELSKAERAGEKVHIITHVPPGARDLTFTWSREYNRIVNRFSATIAAEFNGHTHADQFKVYANPEGKPINVAWGGGSATTYTFYNLNYKIVEINPATYAPENIETYVYNLTEANLRPNVRPHWFKLYDMKNTYSLPDLSAESMNNLVRRMVTTDTHLLNIYAAFHFKLSDYRVPHCHMDCKLNQMCNIVTTVLWDSRRCEEVRRLHAQYSNRALN
ncbi:unnamed protein product [Arctia plantaginis]|uniref:Sphingomyelin phosphodiesterase n=1 Tax=Arctia plantaginis TaxID=874455 RepID=A0A8S0ZZ41_ARCPL|nr:unnamed protein product [Arctia plantaginis]